MISGPTMQYSRRRNHRVHTSVLHVWFDLRSQGEEMPRRNVFVFGHSAARRFSTESRDE